MYRVLVGIVLLASVLTACATDAPRTTSDVWPNFRPAEFARTSGGRDTAVTIRGNPLGMDQAQFEQFVLSNMQGRNWGPRTNFTTRPVNFDNAFQVVMMFNGPGTNPGAFCRNPGAVVPRLTDRQTDVHAFAVYCRFGQFLTLSNGWLRAGSTGITDEAFARLIQQMTADLFPPFNPNDSRRRSSGCRGTC